MHPILLILPPAVAGDLREALAGWPVQEAASLQEGVARCARGHWSAVLLSLDLDGAGPELAARIARRSEVGALLLTHPSPTLELTLLAEAVGAAVLLPEPPDPARVRREVERVVHEGGSIPLPEGEAAADPGSHRIVGSSPALAEAFRTLARVAPTSATVLIRGESGTGKELVARALHAASPRASRPFVAVNCAALPEHLLEAELFGHEKGAFTGAVTRSEGRFGRADGGTLFLDEIGDMSLVLQAKILRALEEREIERVGGRGTIPVDVRVVAATNRPLRELVESGDFRADLFYRLAVVELVLPPLRARPEDLEPLALYFAARFSRQYARPVRRLGAAALERIRRHPWPGNVRELRNVMDRAVLLARGGIISVEDLKLEGGDPGDLAGDGPPDPAGTGALQHPEGATAGQGTGNQAYPSGNIGDPPSPGDSGDPPPPPSAPLRDVEAWHIARALACTGGHMGEAATLLGIHRNTLTAKVREHGLQRGGDR